MTTYHERYVLRTIYSEQRDQWDSIVAGHPQGHLLQSWNWGELKARSGWRPLRVALWDRQEQCFVATAQILRRTAPRVPLWAGHLAYIPKGPAIDWRDAEQCHAFFALLAHRLRRMGALALRIEPNLESGTIEGEIAQKRLQALSMQTVPAVQPLRTILLDLTGNEDSLLAQMKEKWRYNIRLGIRKGVTVRSAETSEDIQAWYRLMQQTSERDHFGIHACSYYHAVWELFAPQGQVRLLLAEHEGQLLAGIVVGLFGRQGLYLYGASGNEQRQLMPNYVLQWEAIRWAKGKGAASYDFWGIPATDAEDEAMAGVYRFKRGWGGHVVQFLGGYEQHYRPLAMNLARRFLPSY